VAKNMRKWNVVNANSGEVLVRGLTQRQAEKKIELAETMGFFPLVVADEQVPLFTEDIEDNSMPEDREPQIVDGVYEEDV
jgi:hypothetical protein